jgi:hypothetical protein
MLRSAGKKMKEDPLRVYLRKLRHDLWIRGLDEADTLEEIESHLQEAVENGLSRGLSEAEAQEQAMERFGTVKLVVNTFYKERSQVMQNLLLTVALLAGLFSAYVDALPKWDDTGILAGGLLLVSGLLTLLGHRRPWLIALAVGLWIPLHDIYLTHNMSMLLVLLFPFVGAYAGWAVRLGIRKTLNLA